MSSRDSRRLHDALADVLAREPVAAVALSGGVDSMTLSHVAANVLGDGVTMLHAVSPAVPPEATERVRRHAHACGWRLELIDAGEFEDVRYRANPTNRCYFCKTNLYGAIVREVVTRGGTHAVYSGTNLDDLGDYRPGLIAATEHSVRHPFVEARIDKRGVRSIAARLGLVDIAELPASPCLSSRVQTGIRIEPAMLTAVNDAERLLVEALAPRTVRCRVRDTAIVVELDEASLGRLDPVARATLSKRVARCFTATDVALRPVEYCPYEMGSAFVHAPASV